MNANPQLLIGKLNQLQPQQLEEVENFVDFLASKSHRQAAWERLLSIAPALETVGAATLSMAEINDEIKSARAARRNVTK